MKETEFNLIDEPWIVVLKQDDSTREVSLKEALLHAHEYKDLAGELSLQNIAVLRLLLAVLHTVFSRADAGGRERTIENEDDALDAWEELWKAGRFPEKPIADYLGKWHERFWLFHPQYPFYQAPEAEKGTFYSASKLIGELSESNNKLRIFASRSGIGKQGLSYAEGARWLLFLNGFDDTSAKPTPKTGWLGKCGLLYAVGKNLFETLMLNFVLLSDGEKSPGKNKPSWEADRFHFEVKKEIAMPDNQAELLTLQSRRILLKRKDEMVLGCNLQAGDYFEERNAFFEQMTVWKRIKPKKGELSYFLPGRCEDSSRQMWRDFANDFAGQAGDHHRPGIVSWIAILKNTHYIEEEMIMKFQKISALYSNSGIPDSALSDAYGDTLTFHTALLTQVGKTWQARIKEEITHIDDMAYYAGLLAEKLKIAAGGSVGNAREMAKAQLYYRVDVPFRKWLKSVDPEDDRVIRENSLEKWEREARSIGTKLGKEMVSSSGITAFSGRYVVKTTGSREEKEYISAPKAMNQYLKQINRIYAKGAKSDGDV